MTERRIAFETARLRLARYRVEGDESRSKAAAHATQVSAEALEVERVGVWLFQRRATHLVCASQYLRSTREHVSGHDLDAARYPRYVRALQERRVIAADDARNHEDTRELAESYLVPLGITSMLDAPIIHGGRVVGVVCHEHVGPARTWSQRDIEFAGTVADMVTLVFEQADRLELEAALQEQAMQRVEQQKMEALGRMACAVAHDFNNLLATLYGTLTLLGKTAPPDLRSHLAQVDSMVELGKRLTQQLLAFGRGEAEGADSVVDLRELLLRIEPVLRTGLGRSISLVIEAPAREPRVVANASQLEQIVLNLCLNARDAIASKGHGRVTVRLRDAEADDDVSSEHVVLEVNDNGMGMNAATSARIFEPFFTTKPAGTGLGLATVYGIVRRCGGVVRVASAPGEGTRMLVALPRAAEP